MVAREEWAGGLGKWVKWVIETSGCGMSESWKYKAELKEYSQWHIIVI